MELHRAAGAPGGETPTSSPTRPVCARTWDSCGPATRWPSTLRILTSRRLDLVNDRTRQINRLREQLLGLFPALERALPRKGRGLVVLLTGYQTPGAIRRLGVRRLESWLKKRGVKSTASLARTAVEAAESQATTLPGEKIAADMAARIAEGVLVLDAEIAELDALIVARFHDHPYAKVIETLPGMGPRLGAEFIAVTDGDLTVFGTPDRLAGFAGLAPVPRDSGRVRGNLHRPRRYHRGLLRAYYLAAMASLRCCPVSQHYYQRKRNEGKSHIQAVLALARRRLNVLWAMIRDNTSYELRPPIPTAA
ncbi:transposase [Streptomyces europaeiscabiei]|uniref:transposase n=1 Tax=Streptomyces europaeiscabiei TaxID=146819 RepID=UPI0038F77B1E